MDPVAARADPRRAAAARAVIETLGDRLETFDPGDDVLPGITPIPSPGHTPHALSFEIGTATERLLYVADAVAHPLHFKHPDWYLGPDLDPAGAVQTRKTLLDRAARTGALLMAYHLPFPPVGRVQSDAGSAYRWHPLAAR